MLQIQQETTVNVHPCSCTQTGMSMFSCCVLCLFVLPDAYGHENDQNPHEIKRTKKKFALMSCAFSVVVFLIYSFVWGLVHRAVSCPYSDVNLNKEGLLQDRLIGEKPPALAGPQKAKRVEVPTPVSVPAPTVPEPSDDSPQSRSAPREACTRQQGGSGGACTWV